LYALAQVLLRGPSSLSEGERELISAFVSHKNECIFCTSSHAAAARYFFKDKEQVVDIVLDDYLNAPVSEKLKTLLTIAGKVQADARTVSSADIENSKKEGATDREIHDTILIAASFCMFNKYVDGLATLTPSPDDKQVWEEMGQRMGSVGYVPPGNQ
jgi:uncharacterized peroxidase-related enzyme